MHTTSYVFDPRPALPLLVTARRYWTADCAHDDPDALTLIFTHATGYHKEHWEPTLEHLFALLRGPGKVKIHDAWCIDAPNHGEAAILNENTLRWGYVPVFPWEEYARAVHLFLAGLGTGVDVDFSKRKLVGVGHSMGATAIILSQTYQPQLPYVATILVDPMVLPPTGEPTTTTRNPLREGAEKRRDIWPSRDEAFAQFSSRPSWKAWDQRVLRLYVEHGLRTLPTAEYPDKTEGVTLTCPKTQEAASFNDRLGRTKAYRYLASVCERMPVHFIYGGLPDPILTEQIRRTVMSLGTQNKHASDQRVPNAGHLIPQMQPEGLANALWGALSSTEGAAPGSSTRSKPERSRL
ncbi:Alpha/beta hydrolase fold-1 [Lenzites betulinus]|nr:Alpha/beta hydrolase fold-1 [Lenzites betulinus]